MFSLLASATLSCLSVGYSYDAPTKTETFFNNRTGLVLGSFRDANRPAPNPRQAAKDRGLCMDYPAASVSFGAMG
jgi:hypothetical protein